MVGGFDLLVLILIGYRCGNNFARGNGNATGLV